MKAKTGELLSIIAMLFTLLGVSSSENPILLILAYSVHEAGHVFFSCIAGAKIRKIKGRVFKLSLVYDTGSISYLREALICSGGIIFNLITAFFSYLCVKNPQSTFVILNFSLALMNLCPVSILDGGGILKSLLLIKTRQDVAEKICFCVSFAMAMIMWLITVYLQIVFMANVSLFLISVLLLIQLCFSI